MYQAVFLDRDGVINRERSDYVKSWAEFEWLPGVLDALAHLAALDCPILVVSNQSAIGRGLVTPEVVGDIHAEMTRGVAATGGRIDGIYVCPHDPAEGCSCRKPEPGLLFRAAGEHGLNLSQCIFVGDSATDMLAAEAAGCGCILVQSGRQGSGLSAVAASRPNVKLVADLQAAVSAIMANEGSRLRKTPTAKET